ncbi:MAG: DUF2796 domain-containing protein [Aquincola tertiaricarbonis]
MTTARRRSLPLAALLAAAVLPGLALAQAHHHAAHEHGRASVDIAIERTQLTLSLDTPLDNLLGFERAPRSAAERQAADAAVARLRAADGWVRIDPKAGCTLAEVVLESAALGLGGGTHREGEHAEMEGSVTYRCTDATQATYIELGLADAFKRVRTVDVQVAGPNGQLKRTLGGKTRRISLSR